MSYIYNNVSLFPLNAPSPDQLAKCDKWTHQDTSLAAAYIVNYS